MLSLRRIAAAVAAASVAALGLAAPAHAAAEQDQSYTGPFDQVAGVNPTDWVSQSFVAGTTGTLPRLDLYIGIWENSVAGDLGVSVFAVDGSHLPTGPALATASVASSSVPVWPGGVSATPAPTAVSFASPANVVAGTEYAIVLSEATVNVMFGVWMVGTNTNPSPGVAGMSQDQGGSWMTPDTLRTRRLGYITYVDPAAPSSWTVHRQSISLPASGDCTDVVGTGLDYGSGVHGGWQRAWEMWITNPNPEVRGGWACSRALVNKGGQTWMVDNSVL